MRRYYPAAIIGRLKALRAAYRMKRAANREIRDVFTEIYKRGAWGSLGDGHFSGVGSLDVNSSAYVVAVNEFLDKHEIVSLIDCGCGDFRVARQFNLSGRRYIGIDVVEDVVAENERRYGTSSIEFRSLDIVWDELPNAELCLIRQVLQHLSNDAILRLLPKLKKFKYVIITDAQVVDPRSCNADIVSFSGTRSDLGSSLLLEKEPFNLSLETLLDTPLAERSDIRLRSVLLQNHEQTQR